MTIRAGRIAIAVGVALVALAAVGVWLWPRPVEHSVDYKIPGNPASKIAAAQAAAIERRERVIAQTVWKKELEAQEHGRVFEDFWDALNAATNKWEVAEKFKFAEAIFGEWTRKEGLGHGIERWSPANESKTLQIVSYTDWPSKIRDWNQAGWRIMQCEFRHNAFDPQTNQIPARSKFYFCAHLTNAAPSRAVVEGDLVVEWSLRDANQQPAVRRIDLSGAQVLFRDGPPAFTPILTDRFDPPNFSLWIEPLTVYDLDNDGVPEIALPSLNRLYRWREDRYETEDFCSTRRLQILNGLFSDFDGDGVTDYLYLEFDGVFLLKGSPEGKFLLAPRLALGGIEFWGPRTLTCGDIDMDGDLDVFLGQYRPPLELGTMPTPYYDSNDAYPSYLLLNDGGGNLRDATEQSGLAPKRFRRVLGASFVDIDGDAALDLIVTSDFAGVDLYRNVGKGRFKDVNHEWLDETHAFGMSHAFADFDANGRLDFIVAGMTSPTAERLEHLGLTRPSSRLDPAMRRKMAFGNRLYFGREGGRFFEDERGRVVAPGWTWGVTTADFNNDQFPDIYISNGMLSGRSVRDVEGELWLHDIFAGTTNVDSGVSTYFSIKSDRMVRSGFSQGGYDRNRLYLNHKGREFVDVAHLFGVALQADCRNLVAADLDNDGRVDLAVTSIDGTLSNKQKLHLFRNNLPDCGNWIRIDFLDEAGHQSPIGAAAILRASNRTSIEINVTGDSFRSQRPNAVRFGLGKAPEIKELEIRWPGGAVTRLTGPKINQAHSASAPKR